MSGILWAVAWLAGSSGFSDESALEVAPPDRRPGSRPTAFTTMRYINLRSLPLLPLLLKTVHLFLCCLMLRW